MATPPSSRFHEENFLFMLDIVVGINHSAGVAWPQSPHARVEPKNRKCNFTWSNSKQMQLHKWEDLGACLAGGRSDGLKLGESLHPLAVYATQVRPRRMQHHGGAYIP
jgi:hypothetical protein